MSSQVVVEKTPHQLWQQIRYYEGELKKDPDHIRQHQLEDKINELKGKLKELDATSIDCPLPNDDDDDDRYQVGTARTRNAET